MNEKKTILKLDWTLFVRVYRSSDLGNAYVIFVVDLKHKLYKVLLKSTFEVGHWVSQTLMIN